MTSSRVKWLGYLLAMLAGLVLPAATADWPAITPEDKAMTSIPQQPDAPAVMLYREENTDDTKRFRTVYVRIKVLTEAGRKYADVEIPVGRNPFVISELSGRTVHADGQVIPLEDQPLDKIAIKDHGVRVHVKAFTLPAVQVGSILDYRYSLHFPEGSRNAPLWMVQSELFIKKSVFKFVPTKYEPKVEVMRPPSAVTSTVGSATISVDGANNYKYSGNGMSAGPNSEYSWIPYLPAGSSPEEHVISESIPKWVSLEMNDVPPSLQEPNMPPNASMRWRVDFFYRNTAKPDDYWKSAGKAWNKNVDNFLDRKKGIAEAVAQLVGANDTPEIKVQKIYAAVSQMDNQSFSVVPNPDTAQSAGAEDVLQKHSGTHDELNRLFVAMVHAAGIPATMMWVPDRGRTAFNPNFMSTDQLDAEIAIVQLGGQDVFLDPGTKFCPYGMLYWHYTDTRGLRQDGNGGTMLADSPAPNYKQAIVQRVAQLQLTEKGTMEGTLAVGFSGQEAMARRQEGASMDADGRKKLLQDEVRTWLPSGSDVTLTNAPDWDKTEGMLVAKFKITGPLATNNGQQWDIPMHVFEADEKPLFPSAQRTNSVYFDYASRQVDEVHIVLPPGARVEKLPPNAQAKTNYAIYTTEQKREGANGIICIRDLAINSVLFSPSEYKELKDFYDKVAVGDREPAALKGTFQVQKN